MASAALICLGLAAPGAAAAARGGAASTHVATVGTHYAVTKHLCAVAPKPGYAACDAMRLVRVSKSTPGARPYAVKDAYPVGDAGGYTPGDFATAYGFDPAGGTGQTIAVVDAYDDPNIVDDLNTFDTRYGLPAETLGTTFEKVSQTGSTTTLPAADTQGWSGEEALDVEIARGVCNLCKVILVEAKNPSDGNLAAGVKEAVKLGATEVSNSYGGPENSAWTAGQRANYQKLYTDPGVVITASTGDDGWFSWDDATNPYPVNPTTGVPWEPSAEAPNLPASLPTVVAVGGTSLSLTDTGTRATESVWNENGLAAETAISEGEGQGATGGGCSVLYPAKGWQSHVPGWTKTGCGSHRLAADVSADADPNTGFDIWTTYNCGLPCTGFGAWQTIGGTSLSSPLIAAMWALAGGSGGVRYPTLSLYGHAVSAVPPLFDVRSGGNSWCDKDPVCAIDTGQEAQGEENPNDLALAGGTVPMGTLDCGYVRGPTKVNKAPKVVPNNHQCEAAKGYDGPSGVGTPNGLTVFRAMHPSAKIHAPSAIRAKSKATFRAAGRDPFPGGALVHFTWKWGDGRHSSVSSASHPHVYNHAGRFTVTLTVLDRYGRSATITQRVTVHKAKAHHKR